jgi:hypothetical protein
MRILETIFHKFNDPYSLLEFLKFVQSSLPEGHASVLDRRIMENGEIGLTICTKESIIMQTINAAQAKVTKIRVFTAEEFVSYLETESIS